MRVYQCNHICSLANWVGEKGREYSACPFALARADHRAVWLFTRRGPWLSAFFLRSSLNKMLSSESVNWRSLSCTQQEVTGLFPGADWAALSERKWEASGFSRALRRARGRFRRNPIAVLSAGQGRHSVNEDCQITVLERVALVYRAGVERSGTFPREECWTSEGAQKPSALDSAKCEWVHGKCILVAQSNLKCTTSVVSVI